MPDRENVDLIKERAASDERAGLNSFYLPLLGTIFFAGLFAIVYFIFR
jgi:hypothetical protein